MTIQILHIMDEETFAKKFTYKHRTNYILYKFCTWTLWMRRPLRKNFQPRCFSACEPPDLFLRQDKFIKTVVSHDGFKPVRYYMYARSLGKGLIPSSAKIRLIWLGHIFLGHIFVTLIILSSILDFILLLILEKIISHYDHKSPLFGLFFVWIWT